MAGRSRSGDEGLQIFALEELPGVLQGHGRERSHISHSGAKQVGGSSSVPIK